MEQRLEARGKVKLVTAGPDSDMSIGWFSSAAERQGSPADAENFVGIHVGGPTRIGHYFIPRVRNDAGSRTARSIKARCSRRESFTTGRWSTIPAANGGNGEIRVTLGDGLGDARLEAGPKGARRECSIASACSRPHAGGQMVKIYLDDLQYTTQR